MTTYYYGAFAIHDGVNYFVTAKDLSLPSYRQTLFQVARFEGVKKTGERVNEKSIPVTIKVLASSRVQLEQKLDALLAAFALRQQQLTLHAEDGRYWVADATNASVKLSAGRVVSADVSVSFVAQQPYAYASSSSTFTDASRVFSGSAGVWNSPTSPSNPYTLTSAGNQFARPTITLTNNTTANATTLSAGLTSGNAYTSLSVAALPQAATSGQVFLLVSGSHTQRVTLSANASAGATTLSVTSFTANFSYPSSAFCGLDIYLTGLTLTQNPDGNVLSVSGTLGAQDVGNGQSLTIDCDPTSANGYTVIPSSTNTPIGFSGSFPVVEPGTNATTFTLSVDCSNQPTLTFSVTWLPRWLS